MPKVIGEKKSRIHNQVQKQGKQHVKKLIIKIYLFTIFNPILFTKYFRHCLQQGFWSAHS